MSERCDEISQSFQVVTFFTSKNAKKEKIYMYKGLIKINDKNCIQNKLCVTIKD